VKNPLLIPLFLASCLSSCTLLGPPYQQPSSVNTLYPSFNQALTRWRSEPMEVNWWEAFHDPILTKLIEDGIKDNFEFKIALARIQQTQSELGIAKANLFPNITSSGYTNQNRTSAHSRQGRFLPTLRYNLYHYEFDISWEIDLFGRLIHAKNYAKASYEAVIEDTKAVMTSLIAQIASHYIHLRSVQLQLLNLEKLYQNAQNRLNFQNHLKHAGLGVQTEHLQAQANLQDAHARLFPLKADIESTLHALSVLLGKKPTDLKNKLASTLSIPHFPLNLCIGLPSDLMTRRPDIRSAERLAAASFAQIGIARADYFPKLSLTSALGKESLKKNNFFKQASTLYSFGPSMAFSIFDFGRIKMNIKSKKIQHNQAILNYHSIVLKAFQEVETALVNVAEEEAHTSKLGEVVLSSKQAHLAFKKRHQAGIVRQIEVLQAREKMLNDKLNFYQAQEKLSQNVITLYKALGGGWENKDLIFEANQ
jgi:outer membrane protein, multidrug efflux system